MAEIARYRLRLFNQLKLEENSEGLHVVLAQGRGTRVCIPAGWTSICWAIRGRVALEAAGKGWAVDAGRHQVWRDDALVCRSTGAQGWMVAAGNGTAWTDTTRLHTQAADASPLPWCGRISRELAHHMILMNRTAADGGVADGAESIALLWDCAVRAQSELAAYAARCAGRTLERRHRSLARLLRVRHAIRCGLDERQDLAALAKLANYSPCHLLRVHRRVFGESPFEYASRLRDEQAWMLVNNTGLPVRDIATRLGFENQSAFCRAFKTAFGLTTTQARVRAFGSAMQAA